MAFVVVASKLAFLKFEAAENKAHHTLLDHSSLKIKYSRIYQLVYFKLYFSLLYYLNHFHLI